MPKPAAWKVFMQPLTTGTQRWLGSLGLELFAGNGMEHEVSSCISHAIYSSTRLSNNILDNSTLQLQYLCIWIFTYFPLFLGTSLQAFILTRTWKGTHSYLRRERNIIEWHTQSSNWVRRLSEKWLLHQLMVSPLDIRWMAQCHFPSVSWLKVLCINKLTSQCFIQQVELMKIKRSSMFHIHVHQ